MTADSAPSSSAAPPRRHWLSLALRVARLSLRPASRTADLVRSSYDRIAPGYDQAWTDHMRELSIQLLDRLGPAPSPATRCIDLTCGTGFVTAEVARRVAGDGVRPLGVDRSEGMLAVAREHYGDVADFHCDDILHYLRSLPPRSVDMVTCGWGLGYSRPWAVVRQIARVLRPGGRVAIIDNTLFSLAGVLMSAVFAFAEQPRALDHVMKVRFLPSSRSLAVLMRLSRLRVLDRWDGARTYHVPDGRSAIARLTATGAAAGFEFAASPDARDALFDRFARIIEDRQARRRNRAMPDSGVPHSGGSTESGPECASSATDESRGVAVTHRYLAAIAERP